MTGILVINKPMDYTSFDCIAILKGITKEKKIGHTGTLDPNATGVLPICFGKATRLIEYMEKGTKTYIARCRFGLSSNTDDIWGELIPAAECSFPSQNDIEAALQKFQGEIMQTPPMYSAICVNGRRLYSYARSGETVEIKPRKVYIQSISLNGYYPDLKEIEFTVTCGRGTYIRSICHDLGEIFNTKACLSSLTRTFTSGFGLEDSIDFEIARKMSAEELSSHLFSIDKAIKDMPRLMLDDRNARKFMDGIMLRDKGIDQSVIAVFNGDNLIGIAKREEGLLKPNKVFHE